MGWDGLHFAFREFGLVVGPAHLGQAVFDHGHCDTVVDGADERAEVAADAVCLADDGHGLVRDAARAEADLEFVRRLQVDALVGAVLAAQMNPREGQIMQMMAPTITTGDAATDKQIKALQVEMEAKIKAIRDEYQAKIKAAIGERKATMIAPKMSSSATAEEMRGRGMMMSSSSPRRDGEMMRASSTSYGERYGAPMRRDGDRIPETQEVKGESTGGAVSGGSLNEGGIRGFFGKFFGR